MPQYAVRVKSSIRAVPESYYEGALALGATHERSVFFTLLPAAKSGLTAGVVELVVLPEPGGGAEVVELNRRNLQALADRDGVLRHVA